MIHATRYHDISCGHCVTGQENEKGEPGPCTRIHGHNYRIFMTISPKIGRSILLDKVGRVIDFGEIKAKLCSWLDTNWDHKFLVWEDDPRAYQLKTIDETVVITAFNPTAENIAIALVDVIGPAVLGGEVILSSCTVEETRKCSATCELGIYH